MKTTALLVFLSVLLLTQAQSSFSNNSRNNAPHDLDVVVLFVYAVFVLGMIGIGIFLIYRCCKKSQERERIKNMLRQKRYDFAAAMGMNLYQLDNNRRHNYVMHV